MTVAVAPRRRSAASQQSANDWFDSLGWSPFAFQRQVWRSYRGGDSGLIHAATGTGKTLAAWWGPLLEYIDEARDTPARSLKRQTRSTAPALRVLWITPLRALASDTAAALRRPVNDLGLPWTIETRTGDTTSTMRSRQSRRLPTALVTTPESLTLLLSRANAAEQLSDLRLVVVDEWHELMGTKRGVQTQLVLARLRGICPGLRTWGLSATIGNIDDAARSLNGAGADPAKIRIVRGVERKKVVVDSLIPPVIERFPWAGHLGTQLVPQVVAAIEEGETAIVFTNTRSQTEIWYQAILAQRPDWAGTIALHHGSLDRKKRDWVEEGLRTARLRCVVATSSLDLGVDFSPVDRVLQIGSPKGIARLLQRAGRSGHRPGAVSRVTCVPTNTLELIEVAAARDGMAANAIESRYPVRRPLDVLAQHVVTIAVGEGFIPEELLAEVRGTDAFADLPDDEWRWVLSFVSDGGEALKGYPEYSKVARDEHGRWRVTDAGIARRHRQSIGTIVSDGHIVVQYLRGGRLGTVEESFIARLKPRDRFFFAGTPLEFVRVRDMIAWVRRAKTVKGAIPRWMGSRLPLSGELAAAIRERLGEASRAIFRDAEMQALEPILRVQGKWSRIPEPREFLIERVTTREGHHLFFFPFEGRLVHEGLAALFAYRISRVLPITFSLSSNDYGFELLSPQRPPLDQALAAGLLSPDNLTADIGASLNATEMARRQFREIARVSGLVFPGLPRSGKTARQLQASSGLFFDVFQRYDAGNLLLEQSHREVLERQLERTRLGTTLRRISQSEVVITDPKRTPPLAFPLLVDRNRDRVSSEKLTDRIRRMQLALEKAAG
ncbi:MAG TPA: ligase-associated DNA damage response DEXH box helicase [Gemmatimonadaceae bacterium]|nr:ligase-associated DNA damage response DEXH box helicase [Gemmatimonadaceae bacterium]